ncbi:MAG: outer membrane protein transport protein [Thermoanaerobaculia bacterium]
MVGLGLIASGRAQAQGFALEIQSAKAAGLGGAFVALADDPSAAFYNPGGLALLKKKKAAQGGLSVSTFNESLYQGLGPGPAAGTTGEQETPLNLPAHLYLVQPLAQRIVLGVATYSPFWLQTHWRPAATYAGRTLALRSQVESYEVNPSVSFALTPTLGLGVGGAYRTSQVVLERRFQGLNPFTGQLVDVATVKADTDNEASFSWNAGLLWRPGKVAFGLAYRSGVKVDYSGSAKLTQIPTGNAQLDQLFAATLPFGREIPLTTALRFPDLATAGLSVALGQHSSIEVDVSRRGWKKLREVAFRFPGQSDLDQTLALNLEDSQSYRLGLLLGTATGSQFRFGYALEESPVTDVDLSPFWPDADRSTVSAGFGRDWLDVALSWTAYDQRIVRTNRNGVNGNYRANAWAVTVTLKK